jgi:hypothetical protein
VAANATVRLAGLALKLVSRTNLTRRRVGVVRRGRIKTARKALAAQPLAGKAPHRPGNVLNASKWARSIWAWWQWLGWVGGWPWGWHWRWAAGGGIKHVRCCSVRQSHKAGLFKDACHARHLPFNAELPPSAISTRAATCLGLVLVTGALYARLCRVRAARACGAWNARAGCTWKRNRAELSKRAPR